MNAQLDLLAVTFTDIDITQLTVKMSLWSFLLAKILTELQGASIVPGQLPQTESQRGDIMVRSLELQQVALAPLRTLPYPKHPFSSYVRHARLSTQDLT